MPGLGHRAQDHNPQGQIGSRQSRAWHEGAGSARNWAKTWLRALTALVLAELRTWGRGTIRGIKGNMSNNDSSCNRQ